MNKVFFLIIFSLSIFGQNKVRFLISNDAELGSDNYLVTNDIIRELMFKFQRSRYFDLVTDNKSELADEKYFAEFKLNFNIYNESYDGCYIFLMNYELHQIISDTGEYWDGVDSVIKIKNEYTDYRCHNFGNTEISIDIQSLYNKLYILIEEYCSTFDYWIGLEKKAKEFELEKQKLLNKN